MSLLLDKSSELEDILHKLNGPQKEAVLHDEGPIVVFAGAGSGKTAVITTRIVALIQKGVSPRSIVAMTFTNKAAREMKERVIKQSPLAEAVPIGTFHSLCARWLREFAVEIGFSSDFTIYDDSDQNAAIKVVMRELNVADAKLGPKDFIRAIRKAKVRGIHPGDADQHVDLFPLMGAKVYKSYQEYLSKCNSMDFDDLLMNMLLLLKQNKSVKEILQKRFCYIMIDEYQDTNTTQADLITELAGPRKNLLVVGDDDQSIYSWRGADPTNIIEFKKRYADARVIYLEQNYRCAGNIVGAASAIIQNNKGRAEKKLWTENDLGIPLTFHHEYDASLEAFWVTEQIKAEFERQPYEDVAVFYRINAQSRQLEDCFRKQNIPYRMYGSLRFYDRAEIKDLLAYFRLIVNKNDDISFRRVINTPTRGIGKKSVEIIENGAKLRSCSLYSSLPGVLQENSKLTGKLQPFYQLIKNLRSSSDLKPSEILSDLIASLDYVEYLQKKFPETYSDRLANVHELGAALAEYESTNPTTTLSGWLNDVSLMGSEEENNGGVSLMTLHSAKGLEFNRVFIVGVEDGLIPHSHNMDDPTYIEEERRLFYVGITRAKRRLSLLAAKRRRVFTQDMVNSPSRFLAEIPENFFDSHSQRRLGNGDSSREPLGQKSSQVYHSTYGRGLVKRVEYDNGTAKAVVDFRRFGVRKVNVTQLSPFSNS